ncbi:hypothetical protein WA158_001108 [Blastocystis sp. Blastoise]
MKPYDHSKNSPSSSHFTPLKVSTNIDYNESYINEQKSGKISVGLKTKLQKMASSQSSSPTISTLRKSLTQSLTTPTKNNNQDHKSNNTTKGILLNTINHSILRQACTKNSKLGQEIYEMDIQEIDNSFSSSQREAISVIFSRTQQYLQSAFQRCSVLIQKETKDREIKKQEIEKKTQDNLSLPANKELETLKKERDNQLNCLLDEYIQNESIIKSKYNDRLEIINKELIEYQSTYQMKAEEKEKELSILLKDDGLDRSSRIRSQVLERFHNKMNVKEQNIIKKKQDIENDIEEEMKTISRETKDKEKLYKKNYEVKAQQIKDLLKEKKAELFEFRRNAELELRKNKQHVMNTVKDILLTTLSKIKDLYVNFEDVHKTIIKLSSICLSRDISMILIDYMLQYMTTFITSRVGEELKHVTEVENEINSFHSYIQTIMQSYLATFNNNIDDTSDYSLITTGDRLICSTISLQQEILSRTLVELNSASSGFHGEMTILRESTGKKVKDIIDKHLKHDKTLSKLNILTDTISNHISQYDDVISKLAIQELEYEYKNSVHDVLEYSIKLSERFTLDIINRYKRLFYYMNHSDPSPLLFQSILELHLYIVSQDYEVKPFDSSSSSLSLLPSLNNNKSTTNTPSSISSPSIPIVSSDMQMTSSFSSLSSFQGPIHDKCQHKEQYNTDEHNSLYTHYTQQYSNEKKQHENHHSNTYDRYRSHYSSNSVSLSPHKYQKHMHLQDTHNEDSTDSYIYEDNKKKQIQLKKSSSPYHSHYYHMHENNKEQSYKNYKSQNKALKNNIYDQSSPYNKNQSKNNTKDIKESKQNLSKHNFHHNHYSDRHENDIKKTSTSKETTKHVNSHKNYDKNNNKQSINYSHESLSHHHHHSNTSSNIYTAETMDSSMIHNKHHKSSSMPNSMNKKPYKKYISCQPISSIYSTGLSVHYNRYSKENGHKEKQSSFVSFSSSFSIQETSVTDDSEENINTLLSSNKSDSYDYNKEDDDVMIMNSTQRTSIPDYRNDIDRKENDINERHASLHINQSQKNQTYLPSPLKTSLPPLSHSSEIYFVDSTTVSPTTVSTHNISSIPNDMPSNNSSTLPVDLSIDLSALSISLSPEIHNSESNKDMSSNPSVRQLYLSEQVDIPVNDTQLKQNIISMCKVNDLSTKSVDNNKDLSTITDKIPLLNKNTENLSLLNIPIITVDNRSIDIDIDIDSLCEEFDI